MKKVNTEKQEFMNNKWRPVFSWIFQIAVVLVLAAVASIFFCQSVVMQEGSMEPTIATGDKVLLNKLTYKTGEPKRGDIIAFKKDAKEHSSMHIKRVIALPGETIQIRDGVILIDEKEYKEKGNFPKIINPGLAEMQLVLGKNEYFVLGDNRNNSEDSRFAEVENIQDKYIVGKVWLRYAPFNRIGLIGH